MSGGPGAIVPIGLKALEYVTQFTHPIQGDQDGRCFADALLVGGEFTPGIATVRNANVPITWDKQKGYGYSGATIIYSGDDLAEFSVEFMMWAQRQVDSWDLFVTNLLGKRVTSSAQTAAAVAGQQAANTLVLLNSVNAQIQQAAAQGQQPSSQLQAQQTSLQAQYQQQAVASNLVSNKGAASAFGGLPPTPRALGVYHPVLAELGITAVVPKAIHAFDQPSIGKWVKVVDFIQYRAPKPNIGKPAQSTPAAATVTPTAQDAGQLRIRSFLQTSDALEKAIAALSVQGS